MTMTPAERAVIAAARAFRSNCSAANERALFDAVRAMDDGVPSVEDFLTAVYQLAYREGVTSRERALIISARGIAWRLLDGRPGRGESPWAARNARDIAELSADQVMDARGAGPAVRKIWADALRSLGLEPAWTLNRH